jgi:molybdopterin-containing oxidoreductase family membrane subunit
MRKVSNLEAYTLLTYELMNIVIMITGSGRLHITELWHGIQVLNDEHGFLNRATGPYWWAYGQ